MNDHIQQKLSRGQWIAVYPYGYYLGVNHAVCVDPLKKKIVQDLFDKYLSEQYSLSMLADYVQQKYEVPIYKARVENILKNKFYYGVMEVKKKEYPHNYETFITKEQYDTVRKIMKERGRGGTWKPKGSC